MRIIVISLAVAVLVIGGLALIGHNKMQREEEQRKARVLQNYRKTREIRGEQSKRDTEAVNEFNRKLLEKYYGTNTNH